MAKGSPMLHQYQRIKEGNRDKILFFRVGDFYEMFFDDAVLASKELELTLTGKDFGQEERAPMCGVPHHSVEAYVARLIEKGHKVAICEQVEDPSLAKGLVEREVVRVVTPGTVFEHTLLEEDRHNYLASIYIAGGSDKAGLCFADVSTGSATVTQVTGEGFAKKVIAELGRYSPSEVLFNGSILQHKSITTYIKDNLQCSAELLDDEDYATDTARGNLERQFGAEAKGLPGYDTPEMRALGALLGYLWRTQKTGVERLKSLGAYAENQFMNLPPATRANLELCETLRGREKRGTLLWVLDKTSTNMGKRMLRNWLEQPLMDAAAINKRLDAVQELVENSVGRMEIAEILREVFDLERLMTRVVMGSATPRDVRAIAATCAVLPGLLRRLDGFNSTLCREIAVGIDPLEDVAGWAEAAIVDDPPALLKDGGVIRTGYHSEVDELRELYRGSQSTLAAIEARMKEETGIRTLKVGYNKVFGYYLEVSKSFVDQVPESFIRKQTLTNGERYITEELKTLETKILHAGERLVALERQLFSDLLQRIAGELARIQQTADCIARLDVLVGLAQVAVTGRYVRPIVDDGDTVEITQGRHPVIEQMLRDGPFVPNDTKLDCADHRMQIITGPNMAGKSTYMRQTALIVLMAQVGAFVPAEFCQVGVCDAIFTRVGASDDLAQGKSTFMVEMSEVAEILQDATRKSLVILDEIGRGTSTFDGMSIAQAVVEYIASPDAGPACKTMFATHYHELTELEDAIDGVKNYNIAVKKRGDNITFLRRIVRGPADDSYGIQVAKLAGLPESVLARSKEVLRVLEAQANATNRVKQLDFAAVDELQTVEAPSEVLEKLRQADPETLTPLEALKLVYELKQGLDEH